MTALDQVTEQLNKISEKTRTDTELRDRLLRDLPGTLDQMGIKIPEGQRVEALLYENAVEFALLPEMADENELSIKALMQIAGGGECESFLFCNGISPT